MTAECSALTWTSVSSPARLVEHPGRAQKGFKSWWVKRSAENADFWAWQAAAPINSQQLWLLEKEQDESGPQQRALITRLQKIITNENKGDIAWGE